MIIKDETSKGHVLTLIDLSPGDVFRFDHDEYSCREFALRTADGYMWITDISYSNILIDGREIKGNTPVIKYKATLTIEGEA